MRRMGLHHDGYDFLDAAAFKHQSCCRASSRSSRRHCKTLARADKGRERNTTRLELRDPAMLQRFRVSIPR